MKTSTALRLGLFAFGTAAACAWAPIALADDATQTTLGGQADVGGGQMWTVTQLQPSRDSIPFQTAGTLWEATATAAPVNGGVPVVPGFAARGGADSYPVLWPVPTALGINPSALPAGGTATGKLYFDVVGPAPTSVAYNSNGHDTAVWVEPPPAPASQPSTGYSPAPYSMGAAPAATPKVTAPAVPAAPAPTGSSGTPLPAASGSSGTPLPAENSATTPPPAAGSSGTPASGSSGTPASGSSGTPATGTQAPASASPSPAASPAPAAPSPAAATPSSPATAPAPAPTTASGSAGTPLTAPTTTTVVPAG
ncbi:MAG: DUF1942 domain-containing protein [Mycobacterium sp.]|nr:DUF1942 domain-containing protein [Mycobacterium sp.]